MPSAPSSTIADTVSTEANKDTTVAPTLDREATVYLEGGTKAVVQGTLTCARDGDAMELWVEIIQRLPDRKRVLGLAIKQYTCTTAEEPWSVEVFPANGQFIEGHATVRASSKNLVSQKWIHHGERLIKMLPVEM